MRDNLIIDCLENIEESEYIKMAKEIQSRNKLRISNKKMADRICKDIRKGGFGMYAERILENQDGVD